MTQMENQAGQCQSVPPVAWTLVYKIAFSFWQFYYKIAFFKRGLNLQIELFP
jgi:hypothetical protein